MSKDVLKDIEDFFSQYKTRRYHKGQILILNGDETDYVYQLVDGRVKVYDVTYRGDEIILNVFKPPAYFPMSLAINRVPNPYIYEAETDVEIRQAPADEVIKFIKSKPAVMFDLLSRVYLGVDGLLGRITQLMSGSAKTRLLYELFTECRRFSKRKKDGSYALNISVTSLAARSGLSRETVSREMHNLKDAKIISLKGGLVLIPDLAVIESMLDIEE